jgi:hypothetical protein
MELRVSCGKFVWTVDEVIQALVVILLVVILIEAYELVARNVLSLQDICKEPRTKMGHV